MPKINLNKQKKLLILGASGMLAADLIKTFEKSKKYKVTAWGMKDLDIADEKAVMEKITKFSPDVIINAAAYTAVDKAETEYDTAMNVNGYALRGIAETAAKIGALLVHYSTDYVFDGKNPAGYKEDDEPNPQSAYGQSKFVGEQMILMTEANSYGGCGGCGLARSGCAKAAAKIKPLKYYIIRTAWLYGHSSLKLRRASNNGQILTKKNFVDTMLDLSGKYPELKVVNDQIGKPTYTLDLAKKTKEMIESKYSFGIYHFTDETGKKGISWYDFAKEIFKIKKIKIKIKPVTTKEFYGGNPNYLAKRPAYSILVNTKLPKARGWKEALGDYLKGK